MTDIVERLRNASNYYGQPNLYDEAADEIERLQSERNLWEERTKQGAEIIEENVDKIERLRRALVDLRDNAFRYEVEEIQKRVSEALNQRRHR